MVWNQRGKKGVHCGRTLRRDTTNKRKLDKQGIIVKYPKNATQFSNREKESILEDRYGLVDGFPLSTVPQLHEFGNGLEFSLGKRKRWLLPELVQEQVGWDSEGMVEEEDEEQELNVCFVERHSHSDFRRSRGDCLSFYSDKDGQLLKPKKNRYSYLSDIRRLEKDDRPSEICYEICRPPPSPLWPNMREGQFIYECYDKMGKIDMIKGQKSKGFRWGVYGVKDLSINATKELLSDMPKLRRAKTTENKIRIVPRKQFSNAVKGMDTKKGGRSTSFPMGQYIEGLLKGSESAEEVESESFPCFPSATDKKYGKGCAMYIGSEPSATPANKPVHIPAYQDPTTFLEQPKVAITVDIALQDLDETRLMNEWGDIYSEGGTLPRKFTLNITKLLPRNCLHFNSIVLFEDNEKVPEAGASAQTTVSLVPITLGSEMPDLARAVQDFVSKIAEANVSAPLKIKEIVDTAIEVTATASSETKGALKQSYTCSKTAVRSLGFLNKVCGWESEAFTVDAAKQKLKDEYQKERLGSCHGKDDELDSQGMMDCGICFETFEDDDTMLTSLTKCGHAFCSDCWKGHLITQIIQGTHCIGCPGQGCDSKVDDKIIMSVVPAWYNKYLNMKFNKELESSPNWKWCPGGGCKKVVKATSPNLDATTVLCDCGTAWCFQCRQPSHWPATCKESELFEKKGEDYKEVLLKDTNDLVTSVMVKNCPQCDYPIEKYYGCQFMMCVLCQTHFCWNCSTPANYGHSCDKAETDNLTKVELSYKHKRYQFEKLMNVVVKSIQARVPKLLAAKGTKARALETSVTSYKHFSSKIPKEALTESRVSQHMGNIVENGILETMREAVEFEFQAHLVLEGFAKKASVSRVHYKSGLQTMSQLAFVVDRIEYLCQDPFSLYKDGRIHRLETLLAVGKDCILTLKKCCTVKRY